jgi:hypothetical protein
MVGRENARTDARERVLPHLLRDLCVLMCKSISVAFLQAGQRKMFATRDRDRQIARFLSWWKSGAREAIVSICLVAFIAHFLFFPLFGLYSDDYILTLPTMAWSWRDFTSALSDAWIHPSMARPLNFFLRGIFFYFTIHHGHLAPGFLLSWGFVSTNGILLFALIRRILPYTPAFVGSLVFVLFPLDTSRQILMHQTDLLLAIFLLLFCFHLYLARRFWLAYTLVTISLLNLESLFLPFLAAPVLLAGFAGNGSWRECCRKLIVHGLILGVLFGLFVLGRFALGEERARDVSLKPGETIGRMARLGIEGPWHGVEALVLRPIDGAIHCDARMLPYAVLGIAVTLWGLGRPAPQQDKASEINSAAPVSAGRRATLSVVVGGLLVWSLSYVLWVPNEYYPPTIGIGRLTGEHAASAVGAGLVAAGLAGWILSQPLMPKRVLALLFSCYCGALVTFGVHIQLSEYVAYWDQMKRFWSVLLDQIRDIQEGDVVLVEQSSDSRIMPVTKGFPQFGEQGDFPMMLPYFVDFPMSWKQQTRVYGLWPSCPVDDLNDSIKLHTPIWAPALWPTIHSGNFIYFRVTNGQLERVTDWVTIQGKRFKPKAAPKESLPSLRLSKIYLNLTSPADSNRWFTLRNAKNFPH